MPLHAQGAGELAGHRGLQVLRHIGRRQLQRQRFGGDLHPGVLGSGFAFKRQLALRDALGGHGGQHEVALEGHGLLQWQGQVGEFQAQPACLQGCCGLGGLVSPVHRAIAHAGARHAHRPGHGGFGG